MFSYVVFYGNPGASPAVISQNTEGTARAETEARPNPIWMPAIDKGEGRMGDTSLYSPPEEEEERNHWRKVKTEKKKKKRYEEEEWIGECDGAN